MCVAIHKLLDYYAAIEAVNVCTIRYSNATYTIEYS